MLAAGNGGRLAGGGGAKLLGMGLGGPGGTEWARLYGVTAGAVGGRGPCGL